MTRVFVSIKEFDDLWKFVGLDDSDLREVEIFLLLYPQNGKVISGTGGLRKIRWALPGKGKSGGIRIFYIDFPENEVLYFITILKKNEKENISSADKIVISNIIDSIERNLTVKKRRGNRQ